MSLLAKLEPILKNPMVITVIFLVIAAIIVIPILIHQNEIEMFYPYFYGPRFYHRPYYWGYWNSGPWFYPENVFAIRRRPWYFRPRPLIVA